MNGLYFLGKNFGNQMTPNEYHLTPNEYYDEKHQKVEAWLTPSKEEQLILILKGKCPHNKGWKYDGHGHTDDAYICCLCKELKWY